MFLSSTYLPLLLNLKAQFFNIFLSSFESLASWCNPKGMLALDSNLTMFWGFLKINLNLGVGWPYGKG